METINPALFRRLKKIALLSILIIGVILLFSSSLWVVVDTGKTGVETLFGKVRDDELSSGFHIKNPLVRVVKMDVRTEDYTMSAMEAEGARSGDDAINALTKEGLSVKLDITVLFHLIEEKASDVYRDVGTNYNEVIIRPEIRSVIREVMSQYTVRDIYSEKREEATKEIFTALQDRLTPRGIEVEEILLRNVGLPTDLAQSIEEKLRAQQEAERYDFILEKEEKEAKRKRIEAEGQRDAQQIISQGLTQNYLNYLYIQSLKDREGTIYVPINPGNGIPLFRGI